MDKQHKIPPHLVNEEDSFEHPREISHLYRLSNKNFKEEMLRMLKKNPSKNCGTSSQ